MSRHLDNIPLVTDLIAAGDPALKVNADALNQKSSQFEELNTRIDELESAIGQDTSGPIGRAFAIRAEQNGYTTTPKGKNKIEA